MAPILDRVLHSNPVLLARCATRNTDNKSQYNVMSCSLCITSRGTYSIIFSEECKFLCIVQDIFAIGTDILMINRTRDLNIAILFKKLFLNISISLGHCQFKIVPFKDKMPGIEGDSLVMEWKMVNRVDYVIASLYLNNITDKSQLLYQVTPAGSIDGPRLTSHFGNRSNFTVIDNSFRVKITNLQYSDAALYLLNVIVSGNPPPVGEANITVIVEGKHKIICF